METEVEITGSATVFNDGELVVQMQTLSDGSVGAGFIQRVHKIDGRVVQQASREQFLKDLPVNKKFIACARREGGMAEITEAIREAKADRGRE
jgi:hypothetical protein